jgi:hypothetical protein
MRCNATAAISGLFLGMFMLPHLAAQVSANPASTTASTNNSAPVTPATSTAQAPDEATRKISDLVHAGKYTEAQKLTEGLLIAYPDDQRLIKAKALIDKLLAPGGSASAAPASHQPTQPVPNANTEQLTGLDKVDYNALIILARQAQQTTDLDEQKRLLKQFMDQNGAFLQKHPDQMLMWQLRGASAISLNDPLAGYEAGQKLLAVGAAGSSDPALQSLLGQLRNKGWLDKQGMEDAQEYNWLRSLKLSLAYGTWSTGHGFNALLKTTMTLTVSGLGHLEEPVNIRLDNASPTTCRFDGGAMGMITIEPGDAANGIYTTSRKATLIDWHYPATAPCTVNLSVIDKTGKTINSVTVGNGY